MRPRFLKATVASIALITAGSAAMTACAEQTPAAPKKSQAAATQNEITNAETTSLIKASDEGYGAMRAIHSARLAIFEADPDLASTYAEDANDLLTSEKTDWDQYLKAAKDTHGMDKNYVVIDGAIGLSEDFIPTQEKTDAVAKANEHLKNGDQKKGLETLRTAGIGVTVSQVLMPLQATRDHVATAQKMIKKGKFYEANLALKAAEDGLIFDAADVYAPVSNTATDTASANG